MCNPTIGIRNKQSKQCIRIKTEVDLRTRLTEGTNNFVFFVTMNMMVKSHTKIAHKCIFVHTLEHKNRITLHLLTHLNGSPISFMLLNMDLLHSIVPKISRVVVK